MKFEEQFPEAKERWNTKDIDKEQPHFGVPLSWMKQNCLSKQKIREAIEKHSSRSNDQEIVELFIPDAKALLKELGL